MRFQADAMGSRLQDKATSIISLTTTVLTSVRMLPEHGASIALCSVFPIGTAASPASSLAGLVVHPLMSSSSREDLMDEPSVNS